MVAIKIGFYVISDTSLTNNLVCSEYKKVGRKMIKIESYKLRMIKIESK
jgi:hypothetical protein